MTTQIKDLPENESDTPGTRLQAAREKKGFTRKKVAELTGIPVKSLEKIELGGMEPNISRLKSLCTALDIEPLCILTAGENNANDKGANVSFQVSEESIENIHNYISQAKEYLQMLDTLRHNGFEKSIRKAEAYYNELIKTLSFLEYTELLNLAKIRCIEVEDILHERTGPQETKDFFTMYEGEPISEKPDCDEVVNRIIDTAVFGVDLYSLPLGFLSKIAEKNEIVPDRFFFLNWHGHSEIIPKIRDNFLLKTLKCGLDDNFKPQ